MSSIKKSKVSSRPAAYSGTPASGEALRQRIAAKAYELFLKRGGAHGSDQEDWLQAERLVSKESRSRVGDEAGRLGAEAVRFAASRQQSLRR